MTYATLICLLIAVAVTTLVNADIEVSGSLRFDVAEESRVERLFQVFIETFGKKYDNVFEHLYRRSIFQDNLQYIEEHNRQFAKGKYSYTLGVNEFTDMKHEEFLMLYTSRIEIVKRASTSEMVVQNDTKVPEAIDWRTYGYVTHVKNEKSCGSCWAFSVTGSLEGQHAKNSGKLVSLSEQQLVDCSDNYGCYGGTMDEAFKYIMKAGGIESEQDYPYTATKGKCKFSRSLVQVQVYNYNDVTKNEESLKTAVGTVGPVSVAIDASHRSFQSYNSGIYDEPNCSSIRLDHGVLVVGYGTNPSDYWIVKNSWGANWGMDGYIWMSRNKGNQCGIATMASYPITS